MSCYNRLFCTFRYCRFLLISLVVLFYTSPVRAQIYDVNISNSSVDVNVSQLPANAQSFFDSAYNANQLDTTDIQFGDDSPTTTYSADGSGGTPYVQALNDFQSYSYSLPNNSSSNNPFTPVFSGRNPTGLSGSRYINTDISHWALYNNKTYTYSTTPLQVVSSESNNNFNVSLVERRVLPIVAQKNTLINFTNFQNDVISAIIGQDTLSFILRLVSAINSTPSTANFTFNVPEIFGFNTGLQIVIPFADVLNGSGEWSSFTPVINVFRSFISLAYYLAVCVLIIRCVTFYQ